MTEKNFVVSFNAGDDNIDSVLAGYNRQIMEIMITINNCHDYYNAQSRKTTIIYESIQANKRDIDHMIYIYGFELALIKYQTRFNGLNSNISVLIKDLAIMIIDEIICIYEVQKEVENNPIQDYNTVNREIKRERSLSIESDDSYLQFNIDRCTG